MIVILIFPMLIKSVMWKIIAILTFSYIIVSRFLRINTIRDPFNDITMLKLLILLAIVISFFTAIYITGRNLLSDPQKKPNIVVSTIHMLIRSFYTHLQNVYVIISNFFHDSLNLKLNPFYHKLVFFTARMNRQTMRTISFRANLLLAFLPKFLLVGIFIIEIFIYRKLFIFYYSLPIILLPMGMRFLLYIIDSYCQRLVDKYLTNNYEILDIPPYPPGVMLQILPIDTFFQLYKPIFIQGKESPYKDCILSYAFYQSLPSEKLGDKKYAETKEIFYSKIFLSVKTIRELYWQIDYDYITYSLYVNIITYTLYAIGWSYVLISSFQNLYVTDLEWLFIERFQDTYNPFSNLILENYET